MIYCKMNAKSVIKIEDKKPKFTTTAPKKEVVEKKPRVKPTELDEKSKE